MISLACNNKRGDFNLRNLNLTRVNEEAHSIEVRIYAEDTLNNYVPSCGQLSYVNFDKDDNDDRTRIETWIESDTIVSPLYDPLLAKVICFATTRMECIDKLLKCLEKTQIQGVTTNIQFLIAILKNETFKSGRTLTSFLDTFTYVSSTCEVLESGSYALIQDFPGRVGLWNVGVPPSGPMDKRNFLIANYLVQNRASDACIEILLDCLVLKFHCDSVIAVTGSFAHVKLNNSSVSMYESVRVGKGGILEIRMQTMLGCRSYLAIKGGCRTVEYLGSRSTFPSGKFGGLHGGPLKVFDSIPIENIVEESINVSMKKWPEKYKPLIGNEWVILALAGPHGAPDYFTSKDIEMVWSSVYRVGYNSNRLGIRLELDWTPQWSRSNGGWFIKPIFKSTYIVKII